MFLALVSLLAAKPVRWTSPMTGEISLRGLVLPIGGVKEKTLAALRAGIKTVMLPKRNEKDLEDVPAEARREAGVRVPRARRGRDQDGDRRAAGRRAEGGVAAFVPGPGRVGRFSTARRRESRRDNNHRRGLVDPLRRILENRVLGELLAGAEGQHGLASDSRPGSGQIHLAPPQNPPP